MADNIGIIREQGDLFEVKPLTDKEQEIVRKQQEEENKKSSSSK